jgi:hypothetical protein
MFIQLSPADFAAMPRAVAETPAFAARSQLRSNTERKSGA